MADPNYPINNPLFVEQSSTLSENSAALAASGLSTGDLRRRYDFSERFSELAIAQTPFFRLVSMLAKKPTDDPQFKFTEKRQSWMKRYAYVVGHVENTTDEFDDATPKQAGVSAAAVSAVGQSMKVYMASDYKSAGNIQNVFGNTSNAIEVGGAGTRPEFFLPGQIIKIPTTSQANGGANQPNPSTDYLLVRVDSILDGATTKTITGLPANAEVKQLTCTVVRVPASGNFEYSSFHSNAPLKDVATKGIGDDATGRLEARRSYVVGNSHAEGSGLINENWKDNPYSTGYGQTQIFRSEFGMTNTARATALKYEPNEWARVWKDKLIEHKWDIEQAGLFSTQMEDAAGITHTQGAVDYVLKYGNQFSWTSSKNIDSFLGDMSNYLDPRYNQDKATVFLCSTEVYTWLHKLGGFFKNNIDIDDQFRADLAITGRKKVMGLDVTTISTVYGDMNVARCIALDGSNVKILALNLNNVKYRPLVGNGVNRDTSIYVGVQTLENSGVDKRVDMILTEAGFEYMMPESHAIWK